MQENNIYLKPIEIEDAEFLYDLFQYKEYDDIFYEGSTTVESWRNRIQDIKDIPNHNQYIVRLCTNNTSIGCLWFFEDKDEKNTECLQLLIFDRDYLRLGYGTEVVDILKKILIESGKKKIKLWTQETNKRAKEFYFKNGFSVTGTEIEEVDRGRKLEKFVIMECTY